MITLLISFTVLALALFAGFKARAILTIVRRYTAAIVGVCLLICTGIAASAQVTNMPDSTVLYTSLASPFTAALTWAISATAVLVLIGWILKAVRRR